APESAKQLGLVPSQPSDTPEMNPLVQAALRRIERARKPSTPPLSRGGSNRTPAAATAAARVVKEQFEPADVARPEPVAPKRPEARNASANATEVAEQPARADKADAGEAARALSLLTVAPKQAAAKLSQADVEATSGVAAAASASKPETAVQTAVQTDLQTKAEASAAKMLDVNDGAAAAAAAAAAITADKLPPRRVAGVIDDHWLERQGVETLPKVESVELTYDDRAPLSRRFAAAMLDLLVVAFLSGPFAAVIELTIGNWGDPRVWGSMGGIVSVVMFLYLTCSLALASRTLGMKLFSMHAVHADTAHAPTTGQCARRALVYMLSLVTFGLGILYAFFDAEGRTAHDLLSRTVVVKQ
ncbi:MAG: RDD family protein, partial [Acidobacteria bacterium]|nr:RDD family protein [Acidobacteriota bacterium]